MSTLTQIEAVLPKLSPEELERVEVALRRLRDQGVVEARFDGRPWPSTRKEISILLADLEALPPLLAPDEAERFDAWHAAERERQRALFHNGGHGVRTLFT